MKNLALAMVILMVLASSAFAYLPNTVDSYKIISVRQDGAAVLCSVQARFCTGCNPNNACNPGDPEFSHPHAPPYLPCPYSYYGCYPGNVDGRYVAVYVKKLPVGAPFTRKKVLTTTSSPPSGCYFWPLQASGDSTIDTIHVPASGLIVGDKVEVWAEFYCSWCGHWYPCPDTLIIQPGPAAVPSLTNWGLIIFGIVLLGFISWVFIKRRKVIGVRV